jgi:ubiquinone/menaquinone biosynthesis C-methylase UbiE
MTNVIICDPTTMTANPDFGAIKKKQHASWSSGDYAVIGTTLQIVGESLAEAMDLRAGQKVLDVAAGNGNVTLAAARRWCDVTSTDYVESLLDRGRARAQVEGLSVRFQVADAEDLPFKDESFNAVLSTFGAMFSPDQGRTAQEMLRVCKSGGRLGLANWTPDGFIGQMFKTIGKHLPPPAGVKSPALWGTREWIERTFGGEVSSLTTELRQFAFRYRSAQHFLEIFRTYYGPVLKAFETLDTRARKSLADDIVDLIGRLNAAGDGTMVVPSEYLQVVMTKR